MISAISRGTLLCAAAVAAAAAADATAGGTSAAEVLRTSASATLGASDITEAEVYDFVREHQPPSDRSGPAAVSEAYLRANARLAARARALWRGDCAAARDFASVPREVWLNDAAPYAALAEPRTEVRARLLGALASDAGGVVGAAGSVCDGASSASMEAVVARVNAHAWTALSKVPVKFIAAPPDEINNYAPDEVLEGKYTNGTVGSSCTGLGVYITYAMRSVGIPARVAGVPHWNKGAKACPRGDAEAACGDHNWAEVFYCSSSASSRAAEKEHADAELQQERAGPTCGWHFLDPPEGAEAFDKGWFSPYPVQAQLPLAGNHSVYASSWRRTPADGRPREVSADAYGQLPADHFPMVWRDRQGRPSWDDRSVQAWDVTCRYLDAASRPAACNPGSSLAMVA